MNPSPRIGKPARLPGRLVRLACLGAALFLSGRMPLRAATSGEPTVRAGIAEPTVEAGQPTEYRIDVVGGRADRTPPPPEVPGLNIVYSGQSRSIQYDGNTLSSTDTLSYIYSVETARTGRFVIPGQDVQVNGQTFRTAPVTLVVGDGSGGAASRQVFVELLVPKKTAFLGESIPVEVRTFFAPNVPAQLTPDLVLNGEGFSVAKFTPQKEVAPQVVNDVNYRVAASKSAITGLRIGTLSVGPVEVDPIVQLPRPRPRRRSAYSNDPLDAFFNNNFGGMNLQPAQQIKLLADPVPVEIRPLPPQGRPADFTGAIGQFRLEAEAEPRKAQTGDPVTVHLMLSGKGNFDRVNAPLPGDEQGLRTYPATARFKADDEVGLSGVKLFDQVVIADGPRTTLPGYRFNYFDPATGRYVEMDTPPIPVRIEGGSLATPTPAPTLAAPAASATPPPTPTPAPRRAEDILYIRNDAGSLWGRDAFRPVYRQRGFWVAQGGGLAALLGLGAIGFARNRARDEAVRLAAERQRRQAELQRALQREETGRREFYDAATRLARMRAAAASGQPDASPSVQEICRDRRLDPQTADSVEALFRRHDELAYSGGTAAREPVPPAERHGVLAVLETLGRNPRA